MILQNLLRPSPERCTEKELYCREENGQLIFNTWFNLFSVGKWLEYTEIRQFSLKLRAAGSFEVKLFDRNGELSGRTCCFAEETELTIPIPWKDDSFCIWFSFRPTDARASLSGGAYVTDEEPLHEVRLALDICTFRREEYGRRNMAVLKRAVLGNPESPLYGKTEVFLVDNGRTLSVDEFASPHIRVFPNVNAGGSGGFTRGLLEISHDRERLGLTHMIFMDDDAVLEPDSLVRTFALLSFVKDQYRESCIAGAMLRLDRRHVLHEQAAGWDGAMPVIPLPELDLRSFENVLKNEGQVPGEYAAWWFACYPLTVAGPGNLPMPFFLHDDDVEFSLRNRNGIMTLNGINVWHEVFDNKRGSALSYYDVRNILTTDALHPEYKGRKQAFRFILKLTMANVMRYRYKDAALSCLAVEDFCKGPGFLKETDPEAYHGKIAGLGYQIKPAEALTDDPQVLEEIRSFPEQKEKYEIFKERYRKNRRKYLLTLNGWIFPADRRRVYAYPFGIWPTALCGKAKVILFDPDSGKGILVEKSWKGLFGSVCCVLKMGAMLLLRHPAVCRKYRKEEESLRTEEAWRRYLRLEDK